MNGSNQVVWIINHHAYGPGRHENFAKELAKMGYDVVLFASSFEHNTYRETKRYGRFNTYLEENTYGFKRVYIKTPQYSGNGFKRLLNQLVFMYRAVIIGFTRERPNVVIGSSVHLFAALAAYILSKRFKAAFIFEVRDLWPQTLVDIGALREKSPITYLFRILEKFLYTKAKRIISVLPQGDKYITKIGIDEKKIIHIPNGVDLEWFDHYKQSSKIENECLERQLIDSNKTKFIYTGAMGLANGLDVIIEAAEILKNREIDDIRILLVGDGPEKSNLLAKVEALGLDNVCFFSAVAKNEIPLLLIKSDACLSVVKKSRVHQYGLSMNKTFDYLASGRPLISVANVACDLTNVANCGIAIPCEKPEKLADAMVEIAEMDRNTQNALGKNARIYVEENHEFKVLTRRLVKVINSIV